jgi:hypothetical protein
MECNTLEYLEIYYYPESPSFSFGYQSTLPIEMETPFKLEGVEMKKEPKRRIGFI